MGSNPWPRGTWCRCSQCPRKVQDILSDGIAGPTAWCQDGLHCWNTESAAAVYRCRDCSLVSCNVPHCELCDELFQRIVEIHGITIIFKFIIIVTMGYGSKRGGRGGKGQRGGKSRRPVHEPEYVHDRRQGDDESSDDGSGSSSESSGEEEAFVRKRGGQSATVGMLPPSDSETESDEEPVVGRGRARNVVPGDLPPMSSDEDDEEEEDVGRPLPVMKNRRELEEERKMEEELAKLSMIREKREKQRQERIKAEGWDRFAPLTDDNHPPGTTKPSQL